MGDGKHCCESKINEINENKSKKLNRIINMEIMH